jgi:hypothetical protein
VSTLRWIKFGGSPVFCGAIYKQLFELRSDPKILIYYASFRYRLVVGVRESVGVDLCTLTFPIEPPPASL